MRTAYLGLIVALSGTLAGCDRAAPTPASKAPDRGPPSAVYTVLGQIAQLPVPGRPQTEFQVHHQAIDDFIDGRGQAVGMNAMIMSFPLAEGVSLKDLAIGDKVEITFPVWWEDGVPDYHVRQIKKMPADTALEFRAARPPTATPPTPPEKAPG